jgi:hypothetical protein
LECRLGYGNKAEETGAGGKNKLNGESGEGERQHKVN